MAKRRGIRIDEEEKEVARARAATERVQRVPAGFESGQLLLLEIRFRRAWVVVTERHPNDFFSRRNRRRTCACCLRAQPFRYEPPGQFLDLRIRIHACGSQEFLELPEALWNHLFLQLRKPFLRPRFFQIGIGEFADFLGEQRDDVCAQPACARGLRRRQENSRENGRCSGLADCPECFHVMLLSQGPRESLFYALIARGASPNRSRSAAAFARMDFT